MSNAETDPAMRPTYVRYEIVSALSVLAVFMYIDRACLSQVMGDVRKDLGLTDAQKDLVYSAFFWSYALAQVPAGLFGKRFGLRFSLTLLLFIWSLLTALCGLATGFVMLFALRLAVGLAEAGAYPNAAALVKNWFPVQDRGRASSAVAFGGRFGWGISQRLTPPLVGGMMIGGVLIVPGIGWRGALIAFGVLGMLWSVVFWILVRDRPDLHKKTNAAERDYCGTAPVDTQTAFPWREILASRNMWLFGLMQFGINMGWAFLITKLPDMLVERHGVGPEEKGALAALPAWLSCIGLILGGIATDLIAKRMGVRWGRSLPMVVVFCGAAFFYAFAGTFLNPWLVVAALSMVAICSDLGNPPMWAFAQDVGGQHVGAALGWGNMWGNLGAATSPIVLGAIQRQHGWDSVFLAGAASYLVAAAAAFTLDARKPIVR
jgi:MFS transporter, ACS family, glucarate transporter